MDSSPVDDRRAADLKTLYSYLQITRTLRLLPYQA